MDINNIKKNEVAEFEMKLGVKHYLILHTKLLEYASIIHIFH